RGVYDAAGPGDGQQRGGELPAVRLGPARVPRRGAPRGAPRAPPLASAWWQGQAVLEAALAGNGGDWAPVTAPECEGQGLTDEQIARFVGGCTPHPGATLTEPAVLERPLGDLPATYVKCLLDGPEPTDDVAGLLESDHWRLVEMDTGHWPMFSQPRELARILVQQV
ncbi:alpha/beta hydrolase, partial [Streptomyces sp. NPDC059506]|uniref:alpha/beta hydrolase n=1 Tax=Streptomyces sp. NPDC059506 TaxID=3347751 RepID=UPI0036CBDD24